MAQTCIKHEWVGGILLVAFVLAIALYVAQLNNRLKQAYRQAVLLLAESCFVPLFWFSETLTTLLWIVSAIVLMADGGELGGCYEYNALFAGCIVFGVGVVTWPIVVDDYSDAVRHPGKEEAAMLVTAIGSVTMTAVVATSLLQTAAAYFLLVSFSYMTAHYIVIDLIGWTWVRSKLKRQRQDAQRATAAMQADWNISTSVMHMR